MKQSFADEKTGKIIKIPCTQTEACLEDEEDYDPCAHSHDITEKDLKILSKREAAILKAEAQSKAKKEQGEESYKNKSDKGKGERDSKQEDGEKRSQTDNDRRWSKEKTEGNSKREGGEKNIQKDNRRNSKSNRKLANESITKGGVNADGGRTTVGDDDDSGAVSIPKQNRKTCRKKMKENPFYTDRLALPSCASPPLRSPPPQFYPPADEFEDVECRKSKKSKPCRKKTLTGTKTKENSKGEGKEEIEQGSEEQYYEKSEIESESKEEADGRKETDTKAETSEKKMFEGKGTKRLKEQEGSRNRKPCIGRLQRPCKKKGSEISISLLPPSLPPLQRDLPPTSPKDIPEMERQILMAQETDSLEKREHCNNRPANKAKIKRELF